jgi:hypothetical protein
MKEIFLFVVIVAWIALCGWGVEKAGNLIPDRAMRLLTKFLLFVLFAFAPLFSMVARAAEPRAIGERSHNFIKESVHGNALGRKSLNAGYETAKEAIQLVRSLKR